MKKPDAEMNNTELLLEILLLLRVLSRTLAKLQAATPADFPYYEGYEVRKRYGISARTLRRWVQLNVLKPIRREGRRFYHKQDIDNLSLKSAKQKQ